MRTPAAYAAVPFVAGCAAGVVCVGVADPSLALRSGAAAVLALMAAAAWLGDDRAAEASLAIVIGCSLAGLSLGITAARQAYHPPLLAWFEGRTGWETDAPVMVEGVLREDAALTPFGASFVLDVVRVYADGARVDTAGGVRLSVGGVGGAAAITAWRGGRTVRAPALVRLPAAYRNPGLPDERRALARRGIVLVGSIKSAALVELVSAGGRVSEAAAEARAWTRRILARHVGRRSARSGAVATAILIGDRSALDEDDVRRLQEAGTYHVIAISGGNIAILTALLLGVFSMARIPGRASAALTILALVFYAELTGPPASVSRAVMAAVVYLAGRIIDQRGPAMNALCVAGITAVAVSPLAALDAGFILSFGATLGILVGVPAMMAARTPAYPTLFAGREGSRRGTRAALIRGIAGRALRQVAVAAGALLTATVCAELALAPAGAALFSRLTVAGLVLNFAAIPLMTVVQLASMTTLALAPIGPSAADAAGLVTHIAAAGLVDSARLVDLLPWMSRPVVPPAWWLLAVYYGACTALWSRWPRAAAIVVAASAAVIVIGHPATSRDVSRARSGWLRVVFLDVGQGDATLITLPDGKSLLVDAGGLPGTAFDIGERVVVPSLRALGVRRLEELILTHGDPDHVGGALAVSRHFAPRTFREGVPVPPHGGLRELASHAADAGLGWRNVQAGDRDRIAGVDIRVLHPPIPDWERQRVRNDDSIVLELRLGDVSIVLPGDIGREGEQAILPGLALAPLVIVKAAHHGSLTSSTPAFVEAARPAAVVFSAGRQNRYGHPVPIVVSRYVNAGAAVFRTDEDGAVVLETDGKVVDLWTWSGRALRLDAASPSATRLPSARGSRRALIRLATRMPPRAPRTSR